MLHSPFHICEHAARDDRLSLCRLRLVSDKGKRPIALREKSPWPGPQSHYIPGSLVRVHRFRSVWVSKQKARIRFDKKDKNITTGP